MRYVEVPVDLLEASVLVTEVTALTILTKLLAIELSAVLGLVLVVELPPIVAR